MGRSRTAAVIVALLLCAVAAAVGVRDDEIDSAASSCMSEVEYLRYEHQRELGDLESEARKLQHKLSDLDSRIEALNHRVGWLEIAN